MKILVVICTFIIAQADIKAQDNNFVDTTIYTFIVKPDQEQVRLPCGFLAFKEAFKYRVLESNYKIPVYQVLMVHWCGGNLKKEKIYKITARIYKENNDAIFLNTNKEQFLTFEPTFVYEDPIYKYKKIISKIHK